MGIYNALTLEEAEYGFEEFKEKWGKKHPIIIRSWEKKWDELTAYFKYPYDIRRIIYTTNTIEGYHRQLRKVTKTKSAYPSDEALKKIIYLTTAEASKNGICRCENGKNVYHSSISTSMIGYRTNSLFEKTWGFAPEFNRFGSPGKV